MPLNAHQNTFKLVAKYMLELLQKSISEYFFGFQIPA